MQGNVFLMNQRPHAKIQLIWKKKKHPKRHLTFSYTKPFIYYFNWSIYNWLKANFLFQGLLKNHNKLEHFWMRAKRGLGWIRNSQQAFAQGVKVPWPFAFLVVRHMIICGTKMVGYISGHNQFDFTSVISNLQKILSKNSSVWNS